MLLENLTLLTRVLPNRKQYFWAYGEVKNPIGISDRWGNAPSTLEGTLIVYGFLHGAVQHSYHRSPWGFREHLHKPLDKISAGYRPASKEDQQKIRELMQAKLTWLLLTDTL
jgi:hypothetical protein